MFLSSRFFLPLSLKKQPERTNIQAPCSPKEPEPSRQQTTTGCWQSYKDNRRNMSNLHNVICLRSNISGCRPGEPEVEQTCQAGRSRCPDGPPRAPCSPSDTDTACSTGTVTLPRVSVAPSAAQATANEKLFILLWMHPGDIHTACANSRDCLVFLLIHWSPFAAAEVALSSRSVGLRSRFQLQPKNRPGLKCLFNPALLSRAASLGEDTFSRCFCKSVLIESNKLFHIVKHPGF